MGSSHRLFRRVGPEFKARSIKTLILFHFDNRPRKLKNFVEILHSPEMRQKSGKHLNSAVIEPEHGFPTWKTSAKSPQNR